MEEVPRLSWHQDHGASQLLVASTNFGGGVTEQAIDFFRLPLSQPSHPFSLFPFLQFPSLLNITVTLAQV